MRTLFPVLVVAVVVLFGEKAGAQPDVSIEPIEAGLVTERVTAIGEGRDGVIVGTRSGVLRHSANGELVDLPFCNADEATPTLLGEVRLVAMDSNTTEWIVTARRLVWRAVDNDCFQVAQHPRESTITGASLVDGELVALFSDKQQGAISIQPDGTVVTGLLTEVAGDGHGVARLDGSTIHWGSNWISVDGENVDLTPSGPSRVLRVFRQQAETLAAMNTGLFTINNSRLVAAPGWPAGTVLEAVENSPATPGMGAERSINAVGVLSGDDRQQVLFEVLGSGEIRSVAGLDLPPATSLFLDSEDVLWIGTSKGLYRYKPQGRVVADARGVSVEAIVADELILGENRLILNVGGVGTATMWVDVGDCSESSTTPFDTAARAVARVAERFQGDYLAGYNNGALRIRASQRCFDALDVAGQEIVDADVYEGQLSLTSTDGVLVTAGGDQWDLASETTKPAGPTGDPVSLYRDANGNLWVGTGPGTAESATNATPTNLTRALTGFAGRTTTAIEHHRGNGLIWFGTADGLYLLDVDVICIAGCPDDPTSSCDGPVAGCSHFTVDDGLPSTQVTDLDYGEDGLWVATSAGINIESDGGIAPALLDVHVTCDVCNDGSIPWVDGLRQVTIPWDADALSFTTVLADTGDWGGNQSTMQGAAGLNEQPGTTHVLSDVESGRTYDLTVVTIDRHFNESDPIPVRVLVEGKPLGEQAKSPAVIAPAVALAAWLAFVLWRRAGRTGLRNAELKIYSNGDGFASQLLIAPRLFGNRRKATELASRDGFVDLTELRFEERHDASTHSSHFIEDAALHALAPRLLTAFVGDEGAAAFLAQTRSRKRIRLAITQPTSLSWVPWELLGDEGDHLASTRGLAVVRIANLQTDELPAMSSDGLRILAVRCGSGPGDNLVKPFEDQLEALEAGFPSSQVVPFYVDAENEKELTGVESPLAQEWDIIHICGHGQTDENGRASVSVPSSQKRLDGTQASERPIRASAWEAAIKGRPRLVTFAACRVSSPAPTETSQAGLPEHLVRTGSCAYSVGFAYDVGLTNLGEFLRVFYESLAANGQVDLALSDAQVALGPRTRSEQAGAAADTAKESDWAGARLYASRTSGHLYEKR